MIVLDNFLKQKYLTKSAKYEQNGVNQYNLQKSFLDRFLKASLF